MVEKTKQELNEQRTTAASYIITFYQNVMQLNMSYAAYINLLTELHAKYGTEMVNMEDGDKAMLSQQLQGLRYYALITELQQRAICVHTDAVHVAPPEHYIKSTLHLKQEYIIDVPIVTQFVDYMNQYLLDKVIKSMLETSQEIVSQLYGV